MHAFTHSLAHRAPSATRPRVRWQPYNPLSSQSSSSSSLSTRSPSSTQLSSPSSSISSPPSNTPVPETKLSHPSQNQKEIPPSRDSKKQFALGLVDQAVKTLGEIWRPQDIPSVFLTSSRAGPAASGVPEPLSNSLISLTSHRSSGTNSPDVRNIVPIKGFVHEVIRRSRTSGCVLQTALCYLEAIRPRIPELLQKEQCGQGLRGDSDISGRILPATELELKFEQELLQIEASASGMDCTVIPPTIDFVSTVRVADLVTTHSDCSTDICLDLPSSKVQHPSISPDASIPPISMLPSPLLCPRRTFLASLILASKFLQDKCYSNRAWAKLSGLPAREIGRCERALGEALDWRLWVGKTPIQTPSVSSPTVAGPVSSRPVARAQSESNILNTPATRSPFLVRQDTRLPGLLPPSTRVLQRSSTMPAEAFSSFNTNRIGALSKSSKATQEPLDQLSTPFGTGMPVVLSYGDILNQSPSPDNPGLSYSPSSTESSSGDRTIQMSTFIDEPMAPYSVPQAPNATEFWPGLDTNDSQDVRISPLVITTKSNQIGKALMASDNFALHSFIPGVVAGPDLLLPNGCVPPTLNPSWLMEEEPIRPIHVVSS